MKLRGCLKNTAGLVSISGLALLKGEASCFGSPFHCNMREREKERASEKDREGEAPCAL